MSTDPVTSAAAGTTSLPAETLRAVADPVRLRILELLGRESLCVCHLQEELDLQQTLVSHHLRTLRHAGLVEAEPCGRFVYYRLRPGALQGVQELVDGLVVAASRDLPRRPC